MGFSQVNFAAVRMISESISSRLPIRIVQIFLAYEPWFFDQVWSLMKYVREAKEDYCCGWGCRDVGSTACAMRCRGGFVSYISRLSLPAAVYHTPRICHNHATVYSHGEILKTPRYFMKEKLRKRMHFLGSHVGRLQEAVDPSLLPPYVEAPFFDACGLA